MVVCWWFRLIETFQTPALVQSHRYLQHFSRAQTIATPWIHCRLISSLCFYNVIYFLFLFVSTSCFKANWTPPSTLTAFLCVVKRQFVCFIFPFFFLWVSSVVSQHIIMISSIRMADWQIQTYEAFQNVHIHRLILLLYVQKYLLCA